MLNQPLHQINFVEELDESLCKMIGVDHDRTVSTLSNSLFTTSASFYSEKKTKPRFLIYLVFPFVFLIDPSETLGLPPLSAQFLSVLIDLFISMAHRLVLQYQFISDNFGTVTYLYCFGGLLYGYLIYIYMFSFRVSLHAKQYYHLTLLSLLNNVKQMSLDRIDLLGICLQLMSQSMPTQHVEK